MGMRPAGLCQSPSGCSHGLLSLKLEYCDIPFDDCWRPQGLLASRLLGTAIQLFKQAGHHAHGMYPEVGQHIMSDLDCT